MIEFADENPKATTDLFKIEENGRNETIIEKSLISPSEKSEIKAKIIPEKKIAVFVDPVLNENAITVLERRYLKKDETGQVLETPREMFLRVARHVASADKAYGTEESIASIEAKFYNMMADLEFMPNSPTLMNAGRSLGQLSACFVLPVEDSMESIFDAVKNTALIHKSGGGTGFSFSRIRPRNDIVKSTQGIASGPISFLNVFDAATETVKQGGTRRGANMAVMRVDHPDIMDFINCKAEEKKLNNFNISIAVTEKFWAAYKNGSDYDLINPYTKKASGTLNAREVFNDIVDHAWKNGEPGIIFIDKVNADNPTPALGEIESTNPCGEQPLLPFEACNLGSINLSRMIFEDNGTVQIDYPKLKKTVHNAVHFLDNVIDVNRYPLEKIDKQTKSTRKIGLGVMGFADLLALMEIPYMSVHAIDLAGEIMGFINEEAWNKSVELAQVRGPFPAHEDSIFGKNGEPPVRNATRTTIAPTGTISIISGCSSGIEPLFALAFTRHVMDDDKLTEIHPIFCDCLKKEHLYSESMIEQVIEHGSIQGISGIPEVMKNSFQTSHDIKPEWHIKMQAAFQEHTDNAVSKTVNFSNNATREDVATVYTMAHDLDCKGVTIYRDGSRSEQVLNKGKASEVSKEEITTATSKPVAPVERPMILRGFTSKLNTGQGSLYVTVNTDAGNKPVEVFANIGKSGGDTSALSEAIGRLISIALQENVDVREISKTLLGITGSRPVWNDGKLVKSVPDGIGQILLKVFGEISTQNAAEASRNTLSTSPSPLSGPECPDCNSIMEAEGGCSVCHCCGYSHCG